LFAGIGAGEVKTHQVIGKLFPDLLVKVPEPPSQPKKPDRQERQRAAKRGPQVIVGGLDSALVKISRCCNPIPGDPIIGFITRGRGVTVHRSDCPNTKCLVDQDGRLIDVHWDLGVPLTTDLSSYRAKIHVESTDRTGMLSSLSSLISEQEINIVSASARTTKKKTGLLDFEVEVRDANQLNTVIRTLSRVNGVTKVYRIESKLSK
ncbi:bifunctional (p)ppGpp synthetase/guanosine-3',5'-bis(diphosphate) 3'-pyrophosphohydrolase, partial [bacterium]|nr:bifunctional (p)ppGpp synthetase/guanosine-3',5'-bis(diphosphate) 3'-pyrophosphohydrolase [bacterium]